MPFFVGLNRIMLSLGSLPDGQHCPYRCAFCYGELGFSRYPSLSVSQIVASVKTCDADYDIIYVSGDTDSFAPPRTKTGIALLEGLSDLGVDLLFTTRTTFDARDLEALGSIARRLGESDHMLFGCISIPRLDSGGHLESTRTPTPRERVAALEALKKRGLRTVLALRPFLPIIPAREYIEIVSLCRGFTDLVLGECWYADEAGILERRVFRGPTPRDIAFARKKMDFDGNERWWKVWEAHETERAVRECCSSLGLPFFMRSQPAIEHLRNCVSRGPIIGGVSEHGGKPTSD